MAKCKTCGATQDEADFYPSISTYCKVHWRERVKLNREARADQYKEYERSRARLEHRVRAREEYARTERGRAAGRRAKDRWAGDHPDRRSASTAVGNAVRDGRIKKLPCLVCGSSKSHGHHPDYSRPLDVVWLCPLHHKQAHAASVPYEHSGDRKKAIP